MGSLLLDSHWVKPGTSKLSGICKNASSYVDILVGCLSYFYSEFKRLIDLAEKYLIIKYKVGVAV